MTELTPGSDFAGHRIEDVAGQGGMGVVYKATHLALDITVALKLIKPEFARDEAFRERFKRESRLAASIEHPNVLPVRHAGEEDGLLYITMRYVDGTDLRSLIDRTGRVEADRTATIIDGVGAALDAAHASGLVHRDVKPANVLLEGMDGSGHAYLTDFGLTRHTASGAGLTKTGQWVGTLDYVAPEQIEGREVDARADIYALGCVLYESLTGQVPFLKDSEVATMYAHLNEPAPPMREHAPELSPELEEVVTRAMAKDPADRFPSAGDLAVAARAATKGTAVAHPEQSVAAGRAAPATPETAVSPPAVGETAASRPPMAAAQTSAGTPVPPPPPPLPPPPTAESPSAKLGPRAGASPGDGAAGKGGGRKILFAVLGGLALIALALGGLFAAGVIGGDDQAEREREAVARAAAAEQAADEQAAAEETAAESTINDFRGAYESEALSTIELLLVPDAPYQYLGFEENPAVDEYRDIFSALEVEDYQLTVNSLEYEEDSSPPVVNAELAYDYNAGGSEDRLSGKLEWRLERGSEDGDYLIDEITAIPDFYIFLQVPSPPVSYAVDLYAGRTNKVGETEGSINQEGKNVPIRIPLKPEAAPTLSGSETLRSISSFNEESGPSTDTVKITFPYAS
ncbi:MAG: serine/threonine protein kinase [Solirubrobacterales bacterium]